jgi:plasmid stabilization system protein ParE
VKIRWSAEAATNLDEIIVNIVGRSGKEVARKLADSLSSHVAHLETHPQMGRMLPELQRPDVRELIESGYRVSYLLHPDALEVLAIVRPRMPLPRLTLPPIDD